MKEQWKKSEKDAAILEEGLQQEKQECKLKSNTNCCKQWIRYIRLIFLLELTLFLGWGCYMILQSYHSRVMENEATDITREKYPVFESVPEIQKSPPTAEMIFVKPEITDELNNFLEKWKELDLIPSDIIDVIDVDSMQTNTKNSISIPNNNIMEASDINDSSMSSSSEDLVYDKGHIKMWKIFPNNDKTVTFNNNKESVFEQLIEKLYNIAINDLKNFENDNDFTENDDRLKLNNHKNSVLNTFKEIKKGLDVTTLNPENSVDLKISDFENSVQDSKQNLFDILIDLIQDDHSETSSSRDGADEQIDASLDFVICPSYQSHESSDMSSEQSIQSSSTFQFVPPPEFLKQTKKIYNDVDIKNKDKRDADDSNTLTSASSETSASGNDENFDTLISSSINHHSSEISANTKQEEEIQKLMKNVDSSTSKIYFWWMNPPPTSIDNLPIGPKYTSESNEIQNPSLEDTIENTETIDFIQVKNNLHNQSQVEIKTNNFIRPKIVPKYDTIESKIRELNRFNAMIRAMIENESNFNMDDSYDKVTYVDDSSKVIDESEQLQDKLNENFELNKIEEVPIEIRI